jgi:hypothetical protein
MSLPFQLQKIILSFSEKAMDLRGEINVKRLQANNKG